MSYHSKHTFMFPFQWDYIKGIKKESSYNERAKLKDFERLFESLDNGLKKVKYKIDNDTEKYNEYTYFHSFVRKAMFYTEDKDFLRYYELDAPNGEYNIEYLKQNESTKEFETITLQLSLDSICVHTYDIGVGVISFNLTNYKYQNQESILAINEFGRRLYPQFMTDKNRLGAKEVFLANRIYGNIGTLEFDEDFTAYQNPIDVDNTFLPPDHIKKVFGYMGQEQLGDMDNKFVFTKQYEKKDTIRIRQVTDDRMFFLSYYQNGALVDSLAERNQDNEFNYLLNNFWYSYVYGDKDSPTIKNDIFQKIQIEKHSYTRWIDAQRMSGYNGTIYGITRDSFVAIGGSKIFGSHMQTMYYQMAILCLVQRAGILRFSWEVSQITNQIFSNKKANSDNAIKDLYENYIRFINQIYFREVSPQIQGIELYTIFQEAMNLDKDVKDLDGEMQEIFNYLSVREQTKLGKVANLFLPAALLTGFLGMNTFGENAFKYDIPNLLVPNLNLGSLINTIIIVWIVAILTVQFYRYKFKN